MSYLDKKTQQQIKNHQDARNEAIRFSGACGDASLIIHGLLMHRPMKEEEIKEEYEKWRKYFFEKRGEPFI